MSTDNTSSQPYTDASLRNHSSCQPLTTFTSVVHLEQSLSETHKLYGTKHPRYASVLFNLAVVHTEVKLHKEAIPLFEEALSICKTVYGNQRPVEALRLLAEARQQILCAFCGAAPDVLMRLWGCTRRADEVLALQEGQVLRS